MMSIVKTVNRHGGVIAAIKREIISKFYSINTNCEISTAKIEIFKAALVIICSVYIPPNSGIEYNESLCVCLNEIAKTNP